MKAFFPGDEGEGQSFIGYAQSVLGVLSRAMAVAKRMNANAVYPEHLLLGILNEPHSFEHYRGSQSAQLFRQQGMSTSSVQEQATKLFSQHYTGFREGDSNMSKEAQQCMKTAYTLAEHQHASLVSVEHLALALLNYEPLQPLFAPFTFSIQKLTNELAEAIKMGNNDEIEAFLQGRQEHKQVIRKVESNIESSAAQKSCRNCQRSVPVNWKHCAFCGASLLDACPQCGAPRPDIEGARFCFQCGYEFQP